MGSEVNMVKLLIKNFKDSINIMLLNDANIPVWYWHVLKHGQKSFKDIFLPLLLNRDKSKDPDGLTPLHIAYLLKNQLYRTSGQNGEKVLEYLLSIPKLVELDGLTRDKFQALPHQVTPLPIDFNHITLYL